MSVTLVLAWLAGLTITVVAAGYFRSRFFATFAAVIVGVQVAIWIALFRHATGAALIVCYFQAAVFVHFTLLIQGRMRSWAFRALVSVPALWFAAGTMLALPWALVGATGIHPYGWWAPYAFCAFGVVQSLWMRPEIVDLTLDARAAGPTPRRYPRGDALAERPLTIVQISDPHLGPFMSEARLRRACERAAAHDPDLVLITGDFLTMESQRSVELLTRALTPLAPLRGRVFACHGNHDLEAPETVATACERVGVTLLVDDAAVADTPVGPVQIVGLDFTWRDRKERMAAVCQRHPRRGGHLRIVLLHDPGAFKDLGEGEGDLVLSGHTHGGQVGLVSFGINWTVLRLSKAIPDHGFWGRGKDRMYIHRGTGHYGFPVRAGVPAEDSLLRIHRAQ